MEPACCHRVGELFGEPTVLEQETDDGGRKQQYGPGENDRHDAGVIHFQWHESRLAAVHFSPHHTLGVLHRNFANPLRDRDDTRDDQEEEQYHQHENNGSWTGLTRIGSRPCARDKRSPCLSKRRRQARHDSDRDY